MSKSIKNTIKTTPYKINNNGENFTEKACNL